MPELAKRLPTKKSGLRRTAFSKPRAISGVEASPKAQSGAPWIVIFLLVLSFLVYLPSLRNGFVEYDDQAYITQNKQVQSGLRVETVRWALTTYTAGNWHPLTWLSHAADAEVFGLNAAGHHFASMVFHALNVVLLFAVLWRIAGARDRSLVVAALFAVHPLNVECVAWAAERKSLLSTLFFFLALGAYAWWAKQPSLRRYALLVLSFALGLMAKPMVVTLPFVLLLLDYWPLQRVDEWTSPREPWANSRKSAWGLMLEKIPLLLVSAAGAAVTLAAQSRSEAVMPLSTVPAWYRIENAIQSYALYLLKAVWPVGLAALYPRTYPRLLYVVLSFLLLCAISVWVWLERKRRPYLVVGWLWYLGTLVPVIGLVTVGAQALADRYAYIPLIGFFVMLVWLLGEEAEARGITVRWQAACAGAVVIALAAFTVRQVTFWRDDLSLWAHTVEVTKDNFVGEGNLGFALMAAGRKQEAIEHFENAIRLNSKDPTAYIAMGMLIQDRDPRAAVQYSKAALAFAEKPSEFVAIYTNLGLAYRQIGDYAAAVDSFQHVLKIEPTDTKAMVALGNCLLRESAERMQRTTQEHPTAAGFVELGALWEQAQDSERARLAYQAALALDKNSKPAQDGLQRISRQSPTAK